LKPPTRWEIGISPKDGASTINRGLTNKANKAAWWLRNFQFSGGFFVSNWPSPLAKDTRHNRHWAHFSAHRGKSFSDFSGR
jgi:hypothetical protein